MWSDWDALLDEARSRAAENGEIYTEKLEFENKEIIKQGANEYWMDLINDGNKFDHNDNGLVLPWLFKITDIDPVIGQTKLFVSGDDQKIDGVEITLENGATVSTSKDTKIKTKRGYVAAKDLLEDDEVCLD